MRDRACFSMDDDYTQNMVQIHHATDDGAHIFSPLQEGGMKV
jgi:hypothetical protein